MVMEFLEGMTLKHRIAAARVEGYGALFRLSVQRQERRPATVGQKLNVANILEGSVRREGDRVRITAELTKAEDGFQLWSQEYNTEIKDIFAVQDEIARAVTGALQIKLLGTNATSAATATRVANLDAYQAYLQARYFLNLPETFFANHQGF